MRSSFVRGFKEAGENVVEKASKKGAVTKALGVGRSIYFGVKEYQQARIEGNGMFFSGARDLGAFALGEM